MSVFVGTTNEKNYLRDMTGGRRFWPIECGAIKRDLILETREQLFAEAVARYKKGETWYEMPAAVRDVQESRRQIDEWEIAISAIVSNKSQITTRDIAYALKIDIANLDMQTQRRITNIMRFLKWEKKTVLVEDIPTIYWVKQTDLPLKDAAEQEPF